MISDLPTENKSVLLLGVTKLPSPSLGRNPRPHTLHLGDVHNDIFGKNQSKTLNRSQSRDSLTHFYNNNKNDLEIVAPRKKEKFVSFIDSSTTTTTTPTTPTTLTTPTNNNNVNKRLGFCKELPYEYYHQKQQQKQPEQQQKVKNRAVDVAPIMDKSVDSIGSCSLDVDASSTDFSDSSVGSSDCTLRSLGVPTPTSQPLPTFRIEPTYLNSTEPKKPSYLNLACTVNGYSNITNYDSKLRENFRSREVSPIRPLDCHANANSAKYLANCHKSALLSPKMAEHKSQTVVHKSSYSQMNSHKFISDVIYTESDTVDCSTSHTRTSHSVNSYNILVHGKTTTEVNYQNGNGSGGEKSFIQQRVERLYGPGALAQGFFISKRTKNRFSDSENETLNTSDSSCDLSLRQSCSSPALPVLRHLRPEFRAQLPILSPKRINHETQHQHQHQFIQKSTTVPSSLTNSLNGTTNGTAESKCLNNKENIDKNLEDIKTNGSMKSDTIKDGHYFLAILKNETDRLINLAEKAEADIEAQKNIISDDVLGYLRSASGKARLLVNQKMHQFEGLCKKNINQAVGERFPTTPEDLQGFWDMVMLQVTQVDQLFAELDRIRNNHWIIQEKPEVEKSESTKSKKVIIKKPLNVVNVEAQRKQREAAVARRKMLEDKRKAMRTNQQKLNSTTGQNVEIFVPDSSSS